MFPYSEAIIIDGLNVSEWTPAAFSAMKRAGITAANCTCCIWEDFNTTIREVALWKRRFADHAEDITQVYGVEDITRAKREGRVGIILGWQNSSGFDDHLPFVRLIAELGLRVVQLTYNTANAAGCGCYESHDGGLTDFGHDLIGELNAAGILIDLSHVGSQTAADAIRASTRPVAYSHCAPAAHKAHPRNKTDEDLRLIAEHEGFVGLTFFPAFLRHGYESTIDDYVDGAEYVINLVGEERVGIGTDFTEGRSPHFFEYISRDKGYGRRLVDFGSIASLDGMERLENLRNLATAMDRRGWSEERMRRFFGENWLRFLAEVWVEQPEAQLDSNRRVRA